MVLKTVRQMAVLDKPRVEIQKTAEKQKIIEQLIILGLSGMTEETFLYWNRVEYAISNAWAFYISSYAENASVALYARGVEGHVDHVFNGDLDVAVESVVEDRECETGVARITERCDRFNPNKYP